MKTLLAAVAIVGLNALTEGGGCTHCVVSASFTLRPTTVIAACVMSGC
jgi:hypothetical protein